MSAAVLFETFLRHYAEFKRHEAAVVEARSTTTAARRAYEAALPPKSAVYVGAEVVSGEDGRLGAVYLSMPWRGDRDFTEVVLGRPVTLPVGFTLMLPENVQFTLVDEAARRVAVNESTLHGNEGVRS